MRVLLIKALSRYNVLRRFTDEVDRALQARGIETVVADLGQGGTDAEDAAFLSRTGPVDFGFTFFVYSSFVDPATKRSVGEIIGAPMVVQHVDYPLTHRGTLVGTAGSSAILVVDPSHVDTIRKIFGADRFVHVGFNPHAAVGEPHPPASTPAAFAERPIPILFSGSWYAPGERPWKDTPEFVCKLFDDAADLALSLEFIPALDALDTVLRAAGPDPADPQFLVVRMYADLVHEWVRATRRRAFFEAAAKVGLPLTVCGEGYDQAGIDLSSFDCRGSVDIETNIALMRQSKVVANINANFGRGSHERPLTAMLAGAVAASDTSSYYTEAFAPGREIALYRWTHLEEDLAALRDLIEDPVRLHAIAEAGHANACRNHRWDNRIDTILAAADVCRKAWK